MIRIEYDPAEPAAPTGPHGQPGNPHTVRRPGDRRCLACNAELTSAVPKPEAQEDTRG